MRPRNRFERGSGCYTCSNCKKRTRSTGRGDNENCGLCERCYDMAGDENAVTDGDMTAEEFATRWGVLPFTKPEASNTESTSTTKEPEMTATTKTAKSNKSVKAPAAETKSTNPNKKEKAVEPAKKPAAKANEKTKTELNAEISKLRGEMKDLCTLPHARVLTVLARAKGPLTRGTISERCGNKTNVVVGRAVGYSDPAKRAEFRKTRDGIIAGTPLLDSGFVKEKELDVEGTMETVLEITAAGRAALEKFMGMYEKFTKLTTGKASRTLPGLNDHYEALRDAGKLGSSE